MLDDTNFNIHLSSPANTYHTLVIYGCGFPDSHRPRVRHVSTKPFVSVMAHCWGCRQWPIMDHTKTELSGFAGYAQG